jgi:hypothetical protein
MADQRIMGELRKVSPELRQLFPPPEEKWVVTQGS